MALLGTHASPELRRVRMWCKTIAAVRPSPIGVGGTMILAQFSLDIHTRIMVQVRPRDMRASIQRLATVVEVEQSPADGMLWSFVNRDRCKAKMLATTPAPGACGM